MRSPQLLPPAEQSPTLLPQQDSPGSPQRHAPTLLNEKELQLRRMQQQMDEQRRALDEQQAQAQEADTIVRERIASLAAAQARAGEDLPRSDEGVVIPAETYSRLQAYLLKYKDGAGLPVEDEMALRSHFGLLLAPQPEPEPEPEPEPQ